MSHRKKSSGANLIYNQGGNIMSDFEIKDGELIKYSGTAETVVIPETVTKIHTSAFSRRGTVETIVMPEHITVIEPGTFYRMKTLKKVILSPSITEIRYYAFKECWSLEEINIPEGMTVIEQSAFAECKSLKQIIIPDTVTKIEKEAFRGCSALKTVVMSANVTKTGTHAFAECPRLKSMTYRGITFPPCGDGSVINDCLQSIAMKKLSGKMTPAKCGLLWEMYFQNPDDMKISGCIRGGFSAMIPHLMALNDPALMLKILDTGLFVKKKNIDALIQCAIEKKAIEIQIMLMNYKNTHIGYDSQEEIIKRKFEL